MFTNASFEKIRMPHQAGVTLIELIVFILIVSISITGILSIMNFTSKRSADPMARKQAMAVAESLMEEIYLHPFTYCDPDDPAMATAASATDCTGGAGGANDQSRLVSGQLASQAGESRFSQTTPFDHVADYNGFTMTGIKPIDDAATAIPGLGTYNAVVSVTQTGGAGGDFPALPTADALKIIVTVSQTGTSESIALTGYRFRYAPTVAP